MPIIEVLAHPLNLWFFVGMLISSCPDLRFSKKATWILSALCSILLIYLVESGFSRVICGAVMAALILFAAKTHLQSVRITKFLMLLGAASYSVYLVHNPVQSLIIRGSLAAGVDGVWGTFVIVSIGSLLIGIAYYYIWERPTQFFSKRLFARISKGHPS